MTDPKPPTGGDGLSKIGEGLKEVFGGLLAPSQGSNLATSNDDRKMFVLRYSREEQPVYEDQIDGDMPTVKEAFEEYSGALGLDPTRNCTFRKDGVVVDGAATCEFGTESSPVVYVATVVRSTKG